MRKAAQETDKQGTARQHDDDVAAKARR